MKYLATSALAAGFSLAANVASAAPVTIDFGNVLESNFDPGETHVEDGFTFSVVSGIEFSIVTNEGNPPSALVVGTDKAVGIGDTISIMKNNGGLFFFDAVDFASGIDGRITDAVDLIGFRNGVMVESFLDLVSDAEGFVTLSPAFVMAIDELRIVGSGAGEFFLILDNFVFGPAEVVKTPLPGALPLMLAGLGGLSLASRRKAALKAGRTPSAARFARLRSQLNRAGKRAVSI
ncbi:MAG: VPLPA-CTERM sorting domain-containing protein [Amphiplicatus sp.]